VNVGELFLSLGVKGSEKTIGALSETKKGMGELGSMSLEAKAAILGVVYAFERMMAQSSKVGTDLENFNALTGISAQTLQRYQYAARQVGVSNEEMTSSFKGVQNTMTAMRLGKGAPEGLALLSGKVGFDANRAKTDTAYVMKKLQEYANAEHEVGMRNFVLKSFGLSENVMTAMARNAFKPEVMAKAPTYDEKELKQLDRANAAWANLSNKVQMAIGHFNAMHGGQLVKDISLITDKVIKLADVFLKLANTHIFEAATGGVEAVTGALKKPGGTKELGQNVLGFVKEMPGVFSAMASDVLSKSNTNPVSPKMNAAVQPNSTQNNNVNQTFHFQTDGSDHKQVGDVAQKAVTKAFYQIPQQGGGI
jgi:hypothetical protein